MLNRDPPAPSPADPMDGALAEYFDRVDRGAPIDLSTLIAAYPGCETELRAFLSKERNLHEAVAAIPRPASSPSELAGRTLGDFRLIGELGRGGMGVVYEAEQLSLGRRVALKILPFAVMLDKQQLARFKNEARAAATLDHPHIVAIHSVGSEGEVHYYAMQLIAGRSLAQVIAALRRAGHSGSSSGQEAFAAQSTDDQDLSTAFSEADRSPRQGLLDLRPPPCDLAKHLPVPDFASREYFRTVARLGGEAATALDHAHQSGVLHRDIKPANLLLDEIGKLWIADFGLARMEADAGLTMTGDLLGTLRYMAPEQALAQRAVVDYRSDIYSLGATLYELLTLEPAFGETDRAQLLQQIARDEPQAPRQLNAGVPHDLATIVLKAMRKNPEERYATAQALADDLRNFLDDKPIEARPPTRRDRLVKWSRRHPAAIWSTILVLFAVTIAAAGSAVVIAQAYHRETVQRDLAETERQRAELERARAEKNFMRAREAVRDFLVNAARGTGAWGQLSPELRTEFSKQAARFYETLLHEGSSDRSLQHETAVGYQSLANLHFNRQEYPQAEKLFRQSLAILDRLCLEHPNVGEYRRSRAFNNRMFGATLLRTDKLTESDAAHETAIGLYKQLIEEEPGEVALLRQLFENFASLEQVRRQRGDKVWDCTDEALAIYQDAVRRAPENATAHCYLGATFAGKGALDEAINSLREAVRLDPEQAEFHRRLADTLSQQARWDEAIAAYRNAIRLTPNEHRIHLDLGLALGKNGLLDEAIAEHREAARILPEAWYAHYTLGNALYNKELLDEASAAFREAIRLHPDVYQLEIALGGALAKRGRHAEAVSALSTALRQEPNELHARYLLAQTLSAAGQVAESTHEYQTAIEGYRKQIGIHPDEALEHFCLARVLTTCADPTLREPTEALASASRAVELQPTEGYFWNVLGRARFRAADYRGAIEALLHERELGDANATTSFFLAMAEWQLGNTDSAREWHAKGIEWIEQRPQIVGGEIVLIRDEAEQLLSVSAAASREVAAAPGHPVNDELPEASR